MTTKPSQTWEVFTNVSRVASWVSVVGDVDELEHLSRYRASLEDRLGPFRLTADLNVEVTDLEEGSLIRFVADGEDNQVASRIVVRAEVRLSAQNDGTDVEVEGEYEVTGRVATLGSSMIRNKGDKILAEFFTAAEGALG